jgi:hypothetical protein
VRVAIETEVELDTTVNRQESKQALSLGPRDVATSQTTAVKSVLGTLIPRRDVGENTPETVYEIERESENEIIREAANPIVSRSTRGVLIIREKKRTAVRIRNASFALRRAPRPRGSD